MDEIKFKIALKVNDLYYFMMHHKIVSLQVS